MTVKLLGKILDRKYELVHLIGEGGMGAVYEAKHILLHHSVAVKILHSKYAKNPNLVERFVREAQAASAIGHPNITKAIDFGKEKDGLVYIVMELLNGENLLELIQRKGRIPHSKAVTIALQVLSALQSAHKKGIIHRDLKPDNVFLAIDERMREEVKLLDFGVVKFLDDEEEPAFGLTQPGTVVGTPNYLSPEQARGVRDIDARIDIWSVGVILYEALCGQLPFLGESYNEILGKILLEDPPPLESLAPNVPPKLVSIVNKALTKDRNERFQEVGDFIDALIPLQHQKDRQMMSTNVINALEVSAVPRPQVDGENNPIYRKTPDSPSTEPHVDQRDDAVPENSPATILDEKSPISPATKKKPRKLLLIATAVCLVTLASAALLQWDILDGKIAPSLPGTDVDAGKPGDKAATFKDDPLLKVAQDGRNPAPDVVVITVKGLPRKARISLNDKAVKTPIRIPRSETPLTLRVNARGYLPVEKVVIPIEDRQLKISMTKTKARTKRSKRRKRALSRKKRTKKKRGKVWTANPFDK